MLQYPLYELEVGAAACTTGLDILYEGCSFIANGTRCTIKPTYMDLECKCCLQHQPDQSSVNEVTSPTLALLPEDVHGQTMSQTARAPR